MSQEDLHQVILLGLAADNMQHQEVLAQLESAAKAKDFWAFLRDAGDWIKNTADQVVAVFNGGAQIMSREYVQQLAQESGVSNLPKLSAAEL